MRAWIAILLALTSWSVRTASADSADADSVRPPASAAPAVPAAAAPAAADSTSRELLAHDFTFRGRPLPETKTFLITHVGLAARTDPGLSSFYPRSDVYGMADLGVMRNVGRHIALGGNFYVGFDDRRTRLGPKARARFWLNRTLSVDLAPGVLLGGSDDWYGHAEFPGFVGEATFSVGDVVMLTGEIESISVENANGAKEKDTSVYLGTKVGTPTSFGVLGGAVAFTLLTVGLISLLSY